MDNIRELLLNTVNIAKPKLLIGLNQKVRDRLPPSELGVRRLTRSPVKRQVLTQSCDR